MSCFYLKWTKIAHSTSGKQVVSTSVQSYEQFILLLNTYITFLGPLYDTSFFQIGVSPRWFCFSPLEKNHMEHVPPGKTCRFNNPLIRVWRLIKIFVSTQDHKGRLVRMELLILCLRLKCRFLLFSFYEREKWISPDHILLVKGLFYFIWQYSEGTFVNTGSI